MRKRKNKFKGRRVTTDSDLSEEYKNNSYESLIFEHGNAYSEMLTYYKNNIIASVVIKWVLKVLFFVCIMGILLTLLIYFKKSLDYIFQIIKEENISDISIESVLGIISIVVPPICTLIVAFLKLPKLIGKYLFNKNEDDDMNVVIQSIQNHDREIYGINEEKKKGRSEESAKDEEKKKGDALTADTQSIGKPINPGDSA